jgi:glycosyltransferase involved in cell wall biosynthesis
MDFHSLTSKEIGGGVFSTEILVDELRLRGHDTCVFAPVPKPKKLPWFVHWVFMGNTFTRRVKGAVEGWDPDVIVSQGHMYPYTLKGAKGKPNVVVARDHHYRCPQTTNYGNCDNSCAKCCGAQAAITYPFFRYHTELKRKMLKESHAQVVGSKYLARDMKEHFPETNPQVVYPPMNGDHKPDSWNPTHVIYMGKGSYKGADIVGEIASRMLDTNIEFIIAGNQDPEHKAIFEALPNCKVTGFVSRQEVLKQGRILIAPVRWNEPFSRMIAESATVGIPSIISDRGGQKEAMGPGGVVIDDPEDISLWCTTIEKLHRSSGWWNRLSNEALKYSRKFNAKDQAIKMERILEDVVS